MQSTTIGKVGKGVEYAGLIPGTSVGSFGLRSSSPMRSSIFAVRLPRLSRCPMVEKLALTRRLSDAEFPLAKMFVGDANGESVVNAEESKMSEDVERGGMVILEGGMAVIAPDAAKHHGPVDASLEGLLEAT